jgi:hypothetical protein
MKARQKKKEAAPISPRSVFDHAYHILQADIYIRDNRSTLGAQAQARASIILSAFGLELLFKCLIFLDNRIPPSTHRFDVLFRQIHNKHKRLIERAWETDPHGRKIAEKFCKPRGFPADLPNALIACSNAFEDMRYHYENLGGVFYVQALPSLVINVILNEIRPEWKANHATQPTSPAR